SCPSSVAGPGTVPGRGSPSPICTSPLTTEVARSLSPTAAATRAPSTQDRNGPGAGIRPTSRNTSASSTSPAPAPPYSSGSESPSSPSAAPSFQATAGTLARSVRPPWMIAVDISLRRKSAAVSAILCCSAVGRRSMTVLSTWETADAGSDDVALNLGGSPADRGGEGGQPLPRPAAPVPAGDHPESVPPEQVHGGPGDLLLQFGEVELGNGSLGPRRAGARRAGDAQVGNRAQCGVLRTQFCEPSGGLHVVQQ